MGVEILIQAVSKGPWKKGYPIVAKDQPAEWGLLERSPGFVLLTVPDATLGQVENFLYNWKIELTFEVLVSNPQGFRIQVTLPAAISVLFPTQAIRQEIKDYLVARWAVQIVAGQTNNDQVTFDVAKPLTDFWVTPPLVVSAAEFELDIRDKLEQEVDVNRYTFTESDVDIALANGGEMVLSVAQVLARIVDRQA